MSDGVSIEPKASISHKQDRFGNFVLEKCKVFADTRKVELDDMIRVQFDGLGEIKRRQELLNGSSSDSKLIAK